MRSFRKYVIVFSSLLSAVSNVKVSSQNEPTEFLWKLYKFALQSREAHNHPYPYSYKYPGKYPKYYQNYPINTYSQYPGSTYAYGLHHQGYHPSKLYDYASKPNSPFEHFEKHKESVMEVLDTIARNDDLQCVPKLICEVTSGTISGQQQGININTESLLGFLSALNGAQSSPLLYFGKAALLGFTSKGNTGTCSYAYPECPSDPDRIVKYLNNHNGGFFRFFNGATAQNLPQNYHQAPHWRKSFSEQRIQNKYVDYTSSKDGVSFPENEEDNSEQSYSFRSEKTLKFPTNDPVSTVSKDTDEFSSYGHNTLKFPYNENYEDPFRTPKELNFEYEHGLQKPLPNHKAISMIFPSRTGTGDLRLDPEEFKEGQTYFDSDNEVNKDRLNYNSYNGRGFIFPQR